MVENTSSQRAVCQNCGIITQKGKWDFELPYPAQSEPIAAISPSRHPVRRHSRATVRTSSGQKTM